MIKLGFLVGPVGACMLVACAEPSAPSLPADVVVDRSELVELPVDSLLHDVRDMAETAEGHVWILSGFEPHVRVLDRSGEVRSRFGPGGEGPGELRNPWYLVDPLPGDSADMLVWDVGSRRLERYRADGTHLGGTSIVADQGFVLAKFRSESFGEPLAMERFGDGFVLHTTSGQLARTRDFWQSSLIAVDSGGVGRDLIRFSDMLDLDVADLPDVFTHVPLWTTCGPDMLAIFNPRSRSVELVSPDGATVRRALELPSPDVTEADVERWVQHSVRMELRERGRDPDAAGVMPFVQRVVGELVASAPDSAPAVRLRCDPEGALWLQTFATSSDPRGYGPLWYRIGSDPVAVEFPGRFQPLFFGSGGVYGILTDRYDVQTPAWIPTPAWSPDSDGPDRSN